MVRNLAGRTAATTLTKPAFVPGAFGVPIPSAEHQNSTPSQWKRGGDLSQDASVSKLGGLVEFHNLNSTRPMQLRSSSQTLAAGRRPFGETPQRLWATKDAAWQTSLSGGVCYWSGLAGRLTASRQFANVWTIANAKRRCQGPIGVWTRPWPPTRIEH